MINFEQKGDFSKTYNYLKKNSVLNIRTILESYGQQGVLALASATPVDSGKTATSWNYVISTSKKSVSITWTNSNIDNGIPIAIILQYGHTTSNGVFVQGKDYINPVIRPIFDSIARNAWNEVSK